jgi:predicted acyltransferase
LLPELSLLHRLLEIPVRRRDDPHIDDARPPTDETNQGGKLTVVCAADNLCRKLLGIAAEGMKSIRGTRIMGTVTPSGSDISTPAHKTAAEERLVSLDFFRGLTMFLLIGEASHLYLTLNSPELHGTLLGAVGLQLEHHPWNGLRFWDLIQPFFMFIVGVAMPFSFGRRWERGETWNQSLKHALFRSFLLLTFGWALYCIGPGRLTFQLWNVLAQLSFTYFVAFLLMRRSMRFQIGFTFLLLMLTEILYRAWMVPGFNQPFVPGHNFGSWMDLQLMGILSDGHWVAFNAVPTTAHTMWGVLAGQLLRSTRPQHRKILVLCLAGLGGVVLGYALDPVTPIIKRICTTSFVIVSGGWCLLALAFCYWTIDVLKLRKGTWIMTVVGMNSLAIYLFTNSGGEAWFRRVVKPFTEALFGAAGEISAAIATSLVVWFLFWYLCYWLFKKRVFIKI